MTTHNTEKFHQSYEAGKQALERNQYGLSVEYLETAKELVSDNSRLGGEAQIWLVTAYQAANKFDDAIALCEKLITHPNVQTREQAQRILYIMKAPQLERPPEWMSEIPDLADTNQGSPKYVTVKKQTVKDPLEIELENVEAPSTNDQDNQFIAFALGLTALILVGLIWFSRV